jgi:hypothetical protein
MTVKHPYLYNSGTDDKNKYSVYHENDLFLYHVNDYRDVGIYNSEFVDDSLLPNDTTYNALNNVGVGAAYDVNGAGVQCEHVVLFLDLLDYIDGGASQVTSDIKLNNLKIKYDTSKLNILSRIINHKYVPFKTYWSSTSSIHSDITHGSVHVAGQSKVQNPTVIGDVFEQTIDINLGRPKTAAESGPGTATQRFATVVINAPYLGNITADTINYPGYRGYLPLSAEFTTNTNLRFEAVGAIPETKNYDLSSINHLIPGKQMVRAQDHNLTKDDNGSINFRAHIPFEWSSDLQRQLGYPELNINSPLSGDVAENGGSPIRDILDQYPSESNAWVEYTEANSN